MLKNILYNVFGFYRTNWLIATVCIGIVGPISWAYFDDKAPMEILEVKVPEPNVMQGRDLVLVYRVKRDRLCSGVITRLVLDSQDVIQEVLPYYFGNIYNVTGLVQPINKPPGTPRAVGQEELVRVTAPVPRASAPGPAKYQGVVLYYCSWLQERLGFGIQSVTPITDFNILPNPDPMSAVSRPQRIPGSVLPSPAERYGKKPLLFPDR